MKELIVATRNKKKLEEIRVLLEGLDLKITSLLDYPDLPKVEESAKTFAGNAILKAASIAMLTKKLTMGEDSGLEVRVLGNKPGVYSARFSGENATDQKNNAKLLRSLKGIPLKERKARYQCYVALADSKGIVAVVSGRCSGVITFKAKGKNGFGYDPLFLIPRLQKTFGELPNEVKARLSHRSHALKKFRKIIGEYFEGPRR